MNYGIYAVTNRLLCTNAFDEQITALCRSGVSGIILREKDLSARDYMSLSERIMKICGNFCVPFIINSHIECARKLYVSRIQLPFQMFLSEDMSDFKHVTVSVHSVEEAQAAQEHGADMLIAGHIFPTACKQDISPRGLDFLSRVCASVEIPVCAIGGVTRERVGAVLDAGAAGVCVMSELMTCSDPEAVVREYRKTLNRDI